LKIFSHISKEIPILFAVVFLVYNFKLREISSGDTIPANYPAGWNSVPQNIDKHPERNWDIIDNQIARCL